MIHHLTNKFISSWSSDIIWCPSLSCPFLFQVWQTTPGATVPVAIDLCQNNSIQKVNFTSHYQNLPQHSQTRFKSTSSTLMRTLTLVIHWNVGWSRSHSLTSSHFARYLSILVSSQLISSAIQSLCFTLLIVILCRICCCCRMNFFRRPWYNFSLPHKPQPETN